MPRVVIVTGWKIFPNQSGGHLRTGSFARALARLDYDVTIWSLAGRKEDYAFRKKEARVEIEKNLVEEVNLSLWTGILQTLLRRLGFSRIWQYYYYTWGFRHPRLKELIKNADFVVCDFPFNPPLRDILGDKPCFLLSHNLEFVLMNQGNFWSRLFTQAMRRIEERAPRIYDGILACAAEDKEFFERNNGGSCAISLLPNGIDASRYRQNPDHRQNIRQKLGLAAEELLIMFSGSGYLPNVEALDSVREYCRQNREFLIQNKIRILALGSITPSYTNDGVIITTGPVDDVIPYFSAADFALNPVVRGSGSNVKVFEYIASALPILSTGFGVRGTSLMPNEDFLPLDTVDGLTTIIQRIRAEPLAVWHQLGVETLDKFRGFCDMTVLVEREFLQSIRINEAMA